MDLFKYKLFSKIAEYESITKAAHSLNISQSGASHALKSLEKEFGLLLIERNHKKISLTTDGLAMLNQINSIIELEEQLRKKIDEIKGIESGVISIGSFTTITSSWLLNIIKKFNNLHPNIEINLRNGNYSDVYYWLSSRHIDLGFLPLPMSSNFEAIPLHKDEIMCIMPKNHPLAKEKCISFNQIKDEPFIMPDWGEDNDIAWALNNKNFEPNIKYVIESEEVIISLVERGFGISLLPEKTLKRFALDITALQLKDPIYRELCIVVRSLNNISHAVDEFINFTKLFFDNGNYNS